MIGALTGRDRRARRARTTALVLAVATLLPLPRGASALLTGGVVNAGSTFALTALYAPPSLTAAAAGQNVGLSWPAGQNGSGYSVLGVTSSTSSCTGASFAALASTTATTYTDASRSTPPGSWFCYQVKTTYGTWTSVQNNATAAAQLGFVVSSVQLINDGNHSGCAAGTYGVTTALDCGDQFVVTFNQPVNPATGPTSANTVCANQVDKTVFLASTATSGPCGRTESTNLGAFTTATGGLKKARHNATYAWTANNTVMTITVGARISGSTSANVDQPVQFIPSTDVADLLAATGGAHVCDTNVVPGSDCLPAPSGSV